MLPLLVQCQQGGLLLKMVVVVVVCTISRQLQRGSGLHCSIFVCGLDKLGHAALGMGAAAGVCMSGSCTLTACWTAVADAAVAAQATVCSCCRCGGTQRQGTACVFGWVNLVPTGVDRKQPVKGWWSMCMGARLCVLGWTGRA
jgi:hypothetical protein